MVDKNKIKRILFFIFSFYFISLVSLFYSARAENTPDDYLSVEFDNAPLSEIVILVSEISGQSFVISASNEIHLSWVEQNIAKKDLLNSFKKVVVGAGLTLHSVPGDPDLYIIREIASVIPNSSESLGFYHLDNLDPEALKDTSEILYGGALAINTLEDTNVVLFSGSPELVEQFLELLGQIDIPRDTDISVVRLKHVSVKSGLKALEDTKIIEQNTFFPDYWNRSIVIKGNKYQTQVARAVLHSIDRPQIGWIDQLEYIHTVDTDSLTQLVTSACQNVEVRKVSDDRILISGKRQDVDKASALVHKVDGTGLQVQVEAVIAYLTDREFKELGMRLSYTDKKGKYAVNDNLISSLTTKNTGILLDYFNDFLGVKFAADEGVSNGEIISSPVLTVLNGQKARIHVGQNVPYLSQANYNQNNGSETGTSIEREDVGITFSVKPSIEPGGEFVHLEVNQEVSSVADDSQLSQDFIDVVLDKNEIKSTVLVADGDTIFLGGLRSESTGSARDQIPFFGELPIIGRFFAYDAKQTENRHLIVSSDGNP